LTTELARATPELERASLLVQSTFSRDQINQAVEQMAKDGKLVALGPLICDAEQWRLLQASAAAAIDALHHEHPEREGLNLSDLREKLGATKLFDPLIEHLN